jgi:predicted transcriptional regulator
VSYEAVKWAMDQPVERATAKFVLVVMADCVNGESGEMVCWPSSTHICKVTGMDQKTVVECLRRLRASGFIAPTGDKKGATGQVPVYRLTSPGAEQSGAAPGEVHYVYRLTDQKTGEFYIGVRTSKVAAGTDTNYRGSGRWCQVMRLSGAQLSKDILGEFKTRLDAEAAELEAIRQVFMDPKCMNRVIRKTPINGSASEALEHPQTNPDFPDNPPEFRLEPTRISRQPHPKTGDGTRKGTSNGTRKEPGKSACARPDDVGEQVWADWVALRQKKKATVSATVINEARKEAAKADLPFERFLAIWCMRGSQGLQADWLKPSERGNGKPPGRHGGFRERDYSEGATDGVPDA